MSPDLQDSVILIESSDPGISRSHFGTGFVIYRDEKSTYLVTCAHVVKNVGGIKKLKVCGFDATVIASGTEEKPDLAVLRVEGLLDKPLLALSISGKKESRFKVIGFQSLKDYSGMQKSIQGNIGGQIGLLPRGQANCIKAWDLIIDDDHCLQPGL